MQYFEEHDLECCLEVNGVYSPFASIQIVSSIIVQIDGTHRRVEKSHVLPCYGLGLV